MSVAVERLEELELTGDRPRSALSPAWFARRLGFGVLTVLTASLIVFLALHALPTDPAQAILGKQATPEALRQLRDALGLNAPLVDQYTGWLGGLVQGDFGTSLASREPVSASLGPALGNSLTLLIVTAVIAIPLSVVLGAVTALRRDGFFDRATLLGSLTLTAVPEFVIGMLLVILLATVVVNALPAVALLPPGASPLAHPREIALPVLTLVLAVVPYLYRLVRATMIDVLDSEYVTMARLKGMPERVVVLHHALPNALIPVTQASAVIMAYLLGGIVVVEYVFRFPGLGTLLTESIDNRDVPMIEAVTMVLAAGVVLFNLLADVLTVLLTPKLRTGGARR
jgi:peptide/nickel transport system permease protein